MANGLTRKKDRFVQEYIIDFNATRAARDSGYSEKTAYSQGQRLLKNVEVKAAIDNAITDRNERLKMSQDEVLQEITRLARAKMTDYLSYRTEKTVVDYDEEGNPIYGYVQIIEAKPSDEIDGAAISEVSLSKDGTFKFKLHDKNRALELMGRHMGLFNDKLNLLADGLTINVNLVDNGENENVPNEDESLDVQGGDD